MLLLGTEWGPSFLFSVSAPTPHLLLPLGLPSLYCYLNVSFLFEFSIGTFSSLTEVANLQVKPKLIPQRGKDKQNTGSPSPLPGKMMWFPDTSEQGSERAGVWAESLPGRSASPHKLRASYKGLGLSLLTTSLTLLERPGPIPGTSWDMIQFQHLTKIAQDHGEPRRGWLPLQSIGQGCSARSNAKTVIKLTKVSLLFTNGTR